MRLVLATATSRIGIIGIGSNKVATERAAYLAPAITDKQTKGGPCEGPCVIMNYRNAECRRLWKKYCLLNARSVAPSAIHHYLPFKI